MGVLGSLSLLLLHIEGDLTFLPEGAAYLSGHTCVQANHSPFLTPAQQCSRKSSHMSDISDG